eukprot:6051932-Pleurochrysis_carterae.AAC.1
MILSFTTNNHWSGSRRKRGGLGRAWAVARGGGAQQWAAAIATLNEYATCYISFYTRIPCNAKWPHVGVFRALGQVLARMRIYDRLQKCSV